MAEKLPFMQLFPGDWLKDPAVRMLSPAARGIWWDLICIMHEGGRSGVVAGTAEMLSRAVGCQASELCGAVNEFQVCNTCGVVQDDNGRITLTNRRMAREAKEREDGARRQQDFRDRKASNATVTAQSPPILQTSEVQKGSDKACKDDARRGEGTPGKPALTVRQVEVAQFAESVLNGQWVNDGGKWIQRIKANPEKVWRVMADVKCAITERRVKTTPAQMAEFNWGMFK